MKLIIKKIVYQIIKICVIAGFKFSGRAPRVLLFNPRLNKDILRAFGAKIGENNITIHSPLTLHGADGGYHNLTIADNCYLNGNIYLDLHSSLTLEEGVSLGPGVIVMTHNFYNANKYLEDRLPHTCGRKPVLIKKGAGIKANALIVMGVTIGENAVVAGGAVVNRDVADRNFVAGVPAKVLKEIK